MVSDLITGLSDTCLISQGQLFAIGAVSQNDVEFLVYDPNPIGDGIHQGLQEVPLFLDFLEFGLQLVRHVIVCLAKPGKFVMSL